MADKSSLNRITVIRMDLWICWIVIFTLLTYGYYPAHGLVSTNRKICQGTHTGLQHSGGAEGRYEMYRMKYTNCTYVEGNLEIIMLDEKDDYDLSFLKDIEEITGYLLIVGVHARVIPLTSLRLIRGNTKYDDSKNKEYSMYVLGNYKRDRPSVALKEIQLSSFSEILSGDVYFLDNLGLCFISTNVNWEDILPQGVQPNISGSTNPQCGQCDPKCNGTCWGTGPDMCQKLTKVICSPQCNGRCRGEGPNNCCNKECAAGCTGNTLKDCLTCRHVNNNGSCEEFCPPETFYSGPDYKTIPNPNFKYSYGSLCVDKCPAHLLVDGPHCVQECGPDKKNDGKGVCVKCDGPCPKQCEFNEVITSVNIRNLTGCTIIKGMLQILNSFFKRDDYNGVEGLSVSDLWALESVTDVTDFIQIDADVPGLTNLTFLKNLRTINGRKLKDGSALFIQMTNLRTLDLINLDKITTGNIAIRGNRQLCYAHTINFRSIVTDPAGQKTLISDNSDPNKCIQDKAVCAPECSDFGCWGPGNHECLSCRSFNYGKFCLNSCDALPRLYQNGSDVCLACHEECANSCTDSLESSCDACAHVKDGPYCKPKCDISKYPDDDNVCQQCNPLCQEGCTGPKNSVGQGACNSCGLVLFEANNVDVFQCLPENESCPQQYFKEKLTTKGPLEHKMGCKKCFEECLTCDQYGVSYCKTCAHYKQTESYDSPSFRCVAQCDHKVSYASEENGTSYCLPCDDHCNGGCYGPASSQCKRCKQYTLYGDLDIGETDGSFNCTEKCPDNAPHIFPIDDGAITACLAHDPNRKNKIIIIVCSVCGGVVLLGAIILCIIYNLSRRAKAEEETTRIAALISGVDEHLVLTQPMNVSNANPDRAMLRLIKESELKLGSQLGAGAFGTVHKGFWYPENERIKIPVAVKVLNDTSSPSQNDLLEEVHIMASVHHDHCLRILAFCMGSRMMLITPLLHLGNLLDYIHEHKKNIGSKVMLNWCVQIAEGMKYLEEKKIVHRDLAARNVLVQRPEFVKITDFGLSKLLNYNENSVTVTAGRVPIKWLALESIQHRMYTHKSDVWSYGVTLWEIFTYGQKPHGNIESFKIPALLEKGERLSQPEICTIDVYMLMIKCWVLDAGSRPSFKDLSEEFKKMARDPGRYLVIPGDELMRLPSVHDDAKDLWRSQSIPYGDRGEPTVSADDYLQPRSHSQRSDDFIEEESEFNGDGPWDVRENSGTSEKSSLFEDAPRATSPSARPVRTMPPRQSSADSHLSGTPSGGGRSAGVNPPGMTHHNGADVNSRYTSDPCKAALDRQNSADSGGARSQGSQRGVRYNHPRGGNPPPSQNNNNGLIYANNDALSSSHRSNGGRGVGRVGGGGDETDYLQPKHSYNPNEAYLQMLDSPDEQGGLEYSGVQMGGPAISNPEYFVTPGEGHNLLSASTSPSHGSNTGAYDYPAGSNRPKQINAGNDSYNSQEYYNDFPNVKQNSNAHEREGLLQK